MLNILKSLVLALSLIFVFPAITASLAATSEAITLTAAQADAVKRINAFINSFQTLRGDFTQISPKGTTTRGVLLVSKPGKIRFEYEPPNPLLVVSDGKWLMIKNKKRENAKGDQVPLKSTPLRLIVSQKIDLLKEADVISMDEADGLTTIALVDKSGKLGGHIVLVFDNVQDTLQQWVIVDGKGRRTTVQFTNFEKDVKIDQKLFVVKSNTVFGGD